MDNEYLHIPQLTIDTLKRYTDNRLATGSFLRAVLANDLFEAVARADEMNMQTIPLIVKYIYNELPGGCWGSYEAVDAYLASEEMYEDE